jgi:hypothetical protein
MTQNVKSLQLTDTGLLDFDWRIVQIFHPATLSTANMVVGFGNTIEPGFILTGIQFLDQTCPRK